MLRDFKEDFCNLLEGYRIYNQLPLDDTEYPFVVYDCAVFPFDQHLNKMRVTLDIWFNNTNTRENDIIIDNIVSKLDRINVGRFYGRLESVQDIPTQEEELTRYQMILSYTYLGGY